MGKPQDPMLFLGSPPHSRRCYRCRQYKKFNEFYPNKRARCGITGECRVCWKMRERKYKSPEDMFWKRYHAKTIRVGDCMEWQGAAPANVPRVTLRKKQESVRRIVYRLAIGELADHEYVIPACGNTKCVRQSHMKKLSPEEFHVYLESHLPYGESHPFAIHPERLPHGGDHWTRKSPERVPRGERHVGAKITEADIPFIRSLVSAGLFQYEIAAHLGVKQAAISKVVCGRTWKHVQ